MERAWPWKAVGLGLLIILGGCGCGGTTGYQGSCPDSGCALPGVALRFEVGSDREFFNRPWPGEPRLTPDGHLDLHDYPNPAPSSMLQDALITIQSETSGFGTNSAIYLTFDGALDVSSFPGDPADNVKAGSPAFLVDVSAGASRGERIPLVLSYLAGQRQFTPANTLVLRPVLGFPLRQATPYAVVLTREVRSTDGQPLGASDAFERTKYDQPPADPNVKAWWEVLHPVYLQLEGSLKLPRSQIAACTVFTTQAVLDEMDAVAAFVAAQPVPAISSWKRLADQTDFYEFEGWFEMPEFQKGDPPDFEGGGGFVFDAGGAPVVQRTEKIPFTLGIPKSDPPAGGFPVVIQAHGTGGSRFSHFQGTGAPAGVLAKRGLASIGIDQPLHGTRNPWGRDPDLTTFNFYNIVAMRDNFRQGGADLLVVRKLLSDFRVPAAVSPSGADIPVDGQKVGFLGHSQGGLTGPIFLGVAGDVPGAVLSGSGGGLGVAVLEKTQPVNIRSLVVLGFGLVDSELDLDHPALNLFQAFAERADPLNYSRRFIAGPPAGGPPKSVYFSEGLQDVYVVPEQIASLAAASGCALMNPVSKPVEAMQLRGVQPQDPPVSSNAAGPGGAKVTAVLVQYPNDGHFAIFQNPDAQRHYGQFLQTLFEDGIPTVGP